MDIFSTVVFIGVVCLSLLVGALLQNEGRGTLLQHRSGAAGLRLGCPGLRPHRGSSDHPAADRPAGQRLRGLHPAADAGHVGARLLPAVQNVKAVWNVFNWDDVTARYADAKK